MSKQNDNILDDLRVNTFSAIFFIFGWTILLIQNKKDRFKAWEQEA